MKNRKQKSQEYKKKYSQIPRDREERLNWMVDKYNLSPAKMDEIIEKKRNMQFFLQYYEYKIILYEIPEGMPRPRFRFIGKNNYMMAAMQNPNFVQVYSPTAGDDFRFMRQLQQDELIQLQQFVQTPCEVYIESYFPTPSYFNIVDTFIAEIGLHPDIMKPDWDNIGKKYSDMYNHNIWLDDSMVICGTVRKFYSILPRVEIYLKYLNYATNIHQYRNITGRKEYKPEYPIGYLDQKGVPNEQSIPSTTENRDAQ
jgi:Holliday junction resolvase RusA-like endonuclease